jgi:hypothetical protein
MPARLETRTPQQSHRDRALHGINRAGEIGDDASLAVLTMRRDQSIDDGTATFSRASVPTSSRAIKRL